MMTDSQIRRTIRALADGHRDNRTDEIDYTSLAEETAQVLDLYEDDDNYTIPEIVFELALKAE